MFQKIITRISIFSVLLWMSSSITMETELSDDLDAILKELPAIEYNLTEKTYLGKALKLENGYGPMAIPKSFIHEQLSYISIPQDPLLKIAFWDILQDDKDLANKIRTDIAALAAYEESSVSLVKNLDNILPLKLINLNDGREHIKLKIKNDFIQIRLKPWAVTFFKSLSKEQRKAIAESARTWMAVFQKDDADDDQNSL